jgi:hypothetical protein
MVASLVLLVAVAVSGREKPHGRPDVFPSKAYTFYGPKYANVNYPTFIKEKVGHLPSLGRGVMRRLQHGAAFNGTRGMEAAHGAT